MVISYAFLLKESWPKLHIFRMSGIRHFRTLYYVPLVSLPHLLPRPVSILRTEKFEVPLASDGVPFIPNLVKNRSNSMGHTPSQETGSTLSQTKKKSPSPRNMQAHYCVNKRPPPVPVLNHMSPIHSPKQYFLQIRFYIILPSTPIANQYPPYDFPNKCTFLISRMRAAWPTHLIIFDLITLITLYKLNKLWSSSLCTFLQPPPRHSLVQIFSQRTCLPTP